MRIYFWVHHTATCETNTGVQRVVRNLYLGLQNQDVELVPVRWCHERQSIVRAEVTYCTGLSKFDGPIIAVTQDEGTPLHLSEADKSKLTDSWLLIPEVPHVAPDDAPNLAIALDYARYYGLQTACIFYDLIPLRIPGYADMQSEHAKYAHALTAANLVLCISDHSTADLLSWWEEQGYSKAERARVLSCRLPEEFTGVERSDPFQISAEKHFRYLSLGTIDPRKNQLTAMRAFSKLCHERPDLDMRLDLVGHLHPEVANDVHSLCRAQPKIKYHGYLSDSDVKELTARSHATVFVSLEEGFGLPVAESLWRGRPCICSDHGSVAEIAENGGCIRVNASSIESIKNALEALADQPDLRHQLAKQIEGRKFKTWSDYTAEVLQALRSTAKISSIILIEGSLGYQNKSTKIATTAGMQIEHLHWQPASRALLPGSKTNPAPHRSGFGFMKGRTAVLNVETCKDADEAADIIDVARAFGLNITLEATINTPTLLITKAHATTLPTNDDRESMLAAALFTNDYIADLRAKINVGSPISLAGSIVEHSPRIAFPRQIVRMKRLLYWAGLTATQPFNTGIQRVVRHLGSALQRAGIELIPVDWDDQTQTVRILSSEGLETLSHWGGPTFLAPPALPESLQNEWMLIPEISIPVLPPGSNPAALAKSLGMNVAAIFFDLIPMKMPEIYPEAALENLRRYWEIFDSVDVALPISWTAAADLARYQLSRKKPCPILAPCALAGNFNRRQSDSSVGGVPQPAENEPIRILAVGTWEPRKNYPRLLRALRRAQDVSGRKLELTIAGRRAGFTDLDEEIVSLAQNANTQLLEHPTDEVLAEQYRAAHFTIFASWEEGFGLPVVESLGYSKPCICHNGSALIELAPGGGVFPVDMESEDAIASAIDIVSNDFALQSRLTAEAKTRPNRTWDQYADDVLHCIAAFDSRPGWPLPAIVKRAPLLSCVVTTYNRARWLKHSLPRLLEATRQWRDVVEVAVCDNASTDDTADVIRQFSDEKNFKHSRNCENLGMLGNLGASARLSSGAFVWLLGDDDLILDGAIENVLHGIAAHPDIEMAYMNYAYTQFDEPEHISDVEAVLKNAKPIAPGGHNRWVRELRTVAGINENLFTAIYACAFRRDHALRAYQIDTRGSPFSSLATCVPSSVYALGVLQDRPAWWVGDPALVVNMNVSWLRWALLWHLERMPDLYEKADRQGIDRTQLDRYRVNHLADVETWLNMVYFQAEDAIRSNVSVARLIERCKHLPDFRTFYAPKIRRAYEAAYSQGRVVRDSIPPEILFRRYGL